MDVLVVQSQINRLRQKKMKLAILTLILGLSTFAAADPHKVVKEWKEKIKNHHFMCKCM